MTSARDARSRRKSTSRMLDRRRVRSTACLCWAPGLSQGKTLGLPVGAQPELAVIESPQALQRWVTALGALKAGKRRTISVCHFHLL